MKFSIRDLLLVTVIVAILAAWWVDHRRLSNRRFRQQPAPQAFDVSGQGYSFFFGTTR
jgi:hypothetical protein